MAERDKPRDDKPRDDKPRRGKSHDDKPRGGKPTGGKSTGGKSTGDRSGASAPHGGAPRDGAPRGGRPAGDRPSYSKPRSGPPPGSHGRTDYRGGTRPPGRPPSDRPTSGRPRQPYASSDRPPSDRPRYDRPRDTRPRDDRPRDTRPRDASPRDARPGGYPGRGYDRSPDRARSSRPYSDRAGSDRPYPPRPQTDRPYSERPYSDRPRTDRPGSDRPYGDRPRRPPFDARRPYTARQAYGARPQREANVDRDALVGEGEELIAGRRPVEEAFSARREAVRLLIVPERRAALDALAIHATTLRIPVVEVEGGSLTALAGFDGHQGVALVARPRPPGDVDAILVRARERGETPFVLVLDSLEDPQNFGTLLRTAEAAGVHGVIYPTRRSAPLSPSAIKASAGATEHLVLAAVDDLAGTLADLHGDGLRVVGADEDASLAYTDADLRGPLAIVVGSEGRGMSGPVRKRLDLTVKIPMRGKIESLNAAVAGSILLFAAAGQRPIVERPQAEEAAPNPAPRRRTAKPAAAASEPAEVAESVPTEESKPSAESEPAGEGPGEDLLPADA